MMKRKLISLVALVTLTGCTQAQIEQWVEWNYADPVAAQEFANRPEIQWQLRQSDDSSDGPQFSQYLTNNHAHKWDAIAMCESGQNWHLRASNRTGTYGGGLMIRDNVWRHYGGTDFAPTADKATKPEQIEIAERILADVGWGAWDCA